MIGLRELQREALSAFRGDDDSCITAWINVAGIPADTRVRVYRNNLRENYRKCLSNAYAVVLRLVGESCFRGLAARYATEHPSNDGDLQLFSSSFPEFLDKTYDGTAYDYLGDVARLEWAIERALISPLAEPLELAALRSFDPDAGEDVRFLLRSGTRLVESEYPVLRIWQTNQSDDPDTVDLTAGSARLAVLREKDSAEIRSLDSDSFALAEAFGRGFTLGHACQQLNGVPGFDLVESLNSLLSNRCLGGLEVITGN